MTYGTDYLLNCLVDIDMPYVAPVTKSPPKGPLAASGNHLGQHLIIEHLLYLNEPPEIMSLDQSSDLPDSILLSPLLISGVDMKRPWAPFKNQSEFEFTEIWVSAKMGNDTGRRLLAGATGSLPQGLFEGLGLPVLPTGYKAPYSWFDTSKISFTSRKDIDDVLELACEWHVPCVSPGT
jgi:hypothetical protein